jgi:MFS family permease
MVVLDIAIVNVALPSIQTDLEFSQANLQWVISAYALVFGGFLLLGGRVADIVGRRRVFMIGLVAFTIGSLLCGLAWSEASLIGARAIQGAGGAIFPLSFGIIRDEFPREKVGVAIGLVSAVFGIGGGAGIVLSGVIVDNLSWRWLFIIGSIGVALAIAVATYRRRQARRPA